MPLQIVKTGNDINLHHSSFKTRPFGRAVMSEECAADFASKIRNGVIQSKKDRTIDIEMMEKLLNHIQDFKLLTNEEIEYIKQLSDSDKMRIIMTYNKVVDAIQIMFEDK